MVEHKCEKCNAIFYKKSHLIQHINKKKQCEVKEEQNNNQNNIIIKTLKNSKIIQKNDYNNLGTNNIKPNNNFDIPTPTCFYCKKTFYQTSNLKRHQDNHCKVKKEQDEQKEEIFKQLLVKEQMLKEKDEIIKDQQAKFNILFEQNLKLIEQNDKIKKTKEFTKINKTIKQLGETIPANSSQIINNQLINSIIDKDKKIEELIIVNKTLMNKKDNQMDNQIDIFENENEIDYCKLENEKKSMNLILNNQIIQFRETDGYINATQLCKAGGKNFGHWNSLESTKKLISVLESNIGIPILDLIDKKIGGDHSNTWIHPDLAIQLAQWLSPEFALQVSNWIRTLFTKGKVEVNLKILKEKENIIKERDARIKILENMSLKRHKRNKFPNKFVVYLITCNELEANRKYIIGKAINLTDRLSSYDKMSNYKVIYNISFDNEEKMSIAENMILTKLNQYREQANRDRFILPIDKGIELFTEPFDMSFNFFK